MPQEMRHAASSGYEVLQGPCHTPAGSMCWFSCFLLQLVMWHDATIVCARAHESSRLTEVVTKPELVVSYVYLYGFHYVSCMTNHMVGLQTMQ